MLDNERSVPMKRFLVVLVAVMTGSSLWATFGSAKPDKVDGVNVPFGRIP